MSDIKFIQYGDIDGVSDAIEKEVVTKQCAKIAAQAKQLTPVDTGRLKGSIGYKTEIEETANPAISGKTKRNVGFVGSAVDYAAYQEFGTRKMSAQPYLRPAVEAVNTNAEQALKKIADGVFKKKGFK